jgi:hypothetical protein
MEENTLEILSKNELSYILCFLDLKSLIMCSRINKKFYSAYLHFNKVMSLNLFGKYLF